MGIEISVTVTGLISTSLPRYMPKGEKGSHHVGKENQLELVDIIMISTFSEIFRGNLFKVLSQTTDLIRNADKAF